jgi:hypothetical protein
MKLSRRFSKLYQLEDIEVYKLVSNGTYRSFPSGFWDGVTGLQSAKKILKYIFEEELNWSSEDIKTKATREILEERKLSGMLSNKFEGSFYKAISETYPELKEWADKLFQTTERGEFEYNRYTDKELIEIIQEKAKELNRLPKTGDIEKPNYEVFKRRFGSWEKALIKAELIENIYEGIDFTKYTKEVIIENLKQITSDKERMLSKSEVYELYPEGVIKEYFGVYSKLEKIISNSFTKKDLIKILKKKEKQLGRMPINKDMKFPKAIVFIDAFGCWDEAIEKF